MNGTYFGGGTLEMKLESLLNVIRADVPIIIQKEDPYGDVLVMAHTTKRQYALIKAMDLNLNVLEVRADDDEIRIRIRKNEKE